MGLISACAKMSRSCTQTAGTKIRCKVLAALDHPSSSSSVFTLHKDVEYDKTTLSLLTSWMVARRTTYCMPSISPVTERPSAEQSHPLEFQQPLGQSKRINTQNNSLKLV